MVTGKLDIYRYDKPTKSWMIHKTNVSLSNADHTIKHSSSRLVCVSNGIVIAASEVDDLDLAFDDVVTYQMVG